MAHTGLLLLDVDGPLNPFAGKPERRPPGYSTFRRTRGGAWFTGRDARHHKGIRVWLNPGHGPVLRALADDTGLELVWATTWMHEANTRIGPAIGLPVLPVIEFPGTDLEPVADGGHRWRRAGTWKWSAAADYAAGRPLAWFDDQHGDLLFAQARAAFDDKRAGSPTLLCHVDPRVGLQSADLDQVRAWARALPATSSPPPKPRRHPEIGRRQS